MLARDAPLTVPARPVDPYVHLDNRGLVIFDGRRGVMFAGAELGWVAETLQILLDEKRATRRHGARVLGGFLSEDGARATLFGGPPDDLATLEVEAETLVVLGERLRGH